MLFTRPKIYHYSSFIPIQAFNESGKSVRRIKALQVPQAANGKKAANSKWVKTIIRGRKKSKQPNQTINRSKQKIDFFFVGHMWMTWWSLPVYTGTQYRSSIILYRCDRNRLFHDWTHVNAFSCPPSTFRYYLTSQYLSTSISIDSCKTHTLRSHRLKRMKIQLVDIVRESQLTLLLHCYHIVTN